VDPAARAVRSLHVRYDSPHTQGLRLSTGPGLPAAALADARAIPGVRSAVALTSTTLGPGLGADDTLPAQILAGGQGGGLNAGVIAGSLSALHGNAIALGRHTADAAHARIGDREAIMLGDGTRTHATVVAIYTRELAFGDALLAPSSPPATRPPRCSAQSSSRPASQRPWPGASRRWLCGTPGCT
jgi:hypothetical protein